MIHTCKVYTPRFPGYDVVGAAFVDLPTSPPTTLVLHTNTVATAANRAPFVCSEYSTGLRIASGHDLVEAYQRALAVIADHGETEFLARILRAHNLGHILNAPQEN